MKISFNLKDGRKITAEAVISQGSYLQYPACTFSAIDYNFSVEKNFDPRDGVEKYFGKTGCGKLVVVDSNSPAIAAFIAACEAHIESRNTDRNEEYNIKNLGH